MSGLAADFENVARGVFPSMFGRTSPNDADRHGFRSGHGWDTARRPGPGGGSGVASTPAFPASKPTNKKGS